MPGMSSGLRTDNSTIVSAFKSALAHEALVVLVILALVALAWNVLRASQLRRSASGEGATGALPPAFPEPAARRLLRISFGLIWILDGILQGQSSMPLGLPSLVVEPTAATSPDWVRHIVNAGATIWTNHPIAASASAVWIQIGIGLFLLVAPRGRLSRCAGGASVAWALIVWIFGESFGGIFAPGLTWLFGAPGAALFYAFAGVLVALPERHYLSPRLGGVALRVTGAFFIGMAVLQAWPGRGFWVGSGRHGGAGTLVSMVRQMAATPQPRLISSWVSGFAAFDAAHGYAVNLFAVVALALLGLALVSGRPRPARWAIVGSTVLCLADWVLIEDFGFFGGVGTDPNSMIPIILILVAGYVAMTRPPVPAGSPALVPGPGLATKWAQHFRTDPTYALRTLAGLGAVGVVLLGAVPMAAASLNPNADPIVAEAIDGTPNAVNGPTPPFSLVDQEGRQVSLAGLRGRAVVLTFLDPVCTSDCPLIAQELRETDVLLGSASSRVEFVAVVANPLYRARPYLTAFDDQEGLDRLPNWLYLTGSLAQLRRVWNSFGVVVDFEPAGSMIAHSDVAYVIDADGHTRFVLDADPGPGTAASVSSFAVTLTNEVEQVLASR